MELTFQNLNLQVNSLKEDNLGYQKQIEQLTQKLNQMSSQYNQVSQEKQNFLSKTKMGFEHDKIALKRENKELRNLIEYYKEQYRGRQKELNQLLDENSRLYNQLQG